MENPFPSNTANANKTGSENEFANVETKISNYKKG